MIDKAKEYGIEKDAENEVNQVFLQVMKQYGLKTVDALYKEMEKAGSDPRRSGTCGSGRQFAIC
jgi:hypothetical protein